MPSRRFGDQGVPAHQITEMTVTGAVDGSVVEDAYRAILSVRRELLDLLDRSACEDAFKEKAHELLMYAVAGGIDMGPELKTLNYLAKANGWGRIEAPTREVVPEGILSIVKSEKTA